MCGVIQGTLGFFMTNHLMLFEEMGCDIRITFPGYEIIGKGNITTDNIFSLYICYVTGSRYLVNTTTSNQMSWEVIHIVKYPHN